MFRSTTIIREPSLEPRKVVFRLRFGKNYVVICDAVVWQHAACITYTDVVLFLPNLNLNVTLVRL